jgi:hypothetical protein
VIGSGKLLTTVAGQLRWAHNLQTASIDGEPALERLSRQPDLTSQPPPGGHGAYIGTYLLENGALLRMREVSGQPVMLITGSPDALAWDGGHDYRLPGGQGRLEFSLDAGNLTLEQPSGGRLTLTPITPEVFLEWDTADFLVRFEQDRRGRTTGSRVSLERAHDVRFERL